MSKKGQVGVIVFFLLITGIIGLFVLLYNVSTQDGYSVDYPYTIEHGKLSGWDKLWLKDDHTTVYCFNDYSMRTTLEKLISEKKKAKIEYSEFIGKGTLCSSGSEKIKSVVITGVSEVEEKSPSNSGGKE